MLRRGDRLGVDSFVGVLAFDGVLPGVLVSVVCLGRVGGGDSSLARTAAVAESGVGGTDNPGGGGGAV